MQYSKKVLQHFRHPKNMGKLKNPDGIGKVGNPICGDVMTIYIKVKNKKITDIKFETFGCVSAIASSSIITSLVKGKKIDYVLKLTKDNVIKKLGGLPPIKIHCSVLAVDTIHEAIYDYLKKKKLKIPKFLEKRHELIIKGSKH